MDSREVSHYCCAHHSHFQDSQPLKRLLGFQDRRSLRALLNSVTNESDRLPSRRLETNEAQE